VHQELLWSATPNPTVVNEKPQYCSNHSGQSHDVDQCRFLIKQEPPKSCRVGIQSKLEAETTASTSTNFSSNNACFSLSTSTARAQRIIHNSLPFKPLHSVSLFSIPKPYFLGALHALVSIPRPMCPNVAPQPTVGTLQSKPNRGRLTL